MMMMMMMMNVSWQAAHQMFADALIFVKDSVFQMLLNFLELEFIWAASLPSVFSLSLCPVSIFSFFSLVPLWLCSVAQFWSGTQGTLIARLGFSLYWTLRLWQLRETYLSFHFCPFVCVCVVKSENTVNWMHFAISRRNAAYFPFCYITVCCKLDQQQSGCVSELSGTCCQLQTIQMDKCGKKKKKKDTQRLTAADTFGCLYTTPESQSWPDNTLRFCAIPNIPPLPHTA